MNTSTDREHAPFLQACKPEPGQGRDRNACLTAGNNEVELFESRQYADQLDARHAKGCFERLKHGRAITCGKRFKECEAILVQVRFFQQLVGLKLSELCFELIDAKKQGLVLPPELSDLAATMAQLADILDCLDEATAAAATAARNPFPAHQASKTDSRKNDGYQIIDKGRNDALHAAQPTTETAENQI